MKGNEYFTYQITIDTTGAAAPLLSFDVECVGSPINIICKRSLQTKN